jgi:hypothetical protein
MNCYEVCSPSSPRYNPKLCKICRFIKELYYWRRWPFPWPPEVEKPIDPHPDPWELRDIGAEVLGELVLEAVMRKDLHSSSKVLTAIRDSGMLQEALKNRSQELEEELNAVNQQLGNLG